MSGGPKKVTGASPSNGRPDLQQARASKGKRTRARLLSATEDLLSEKLVWDLRSVDITRRAGLAPASFYSHFDSVTEAVLELAESLSESSPEIEALASQDWQDVSQARRFIEAHLAHWRQHQAAFRIRNLTADAGDLRFHIAKFNSVLPLLRAFSTRFKAAQEAGRFPPDLDPDAFAGLFIAMLERTAAVVPRVEAKSLPSSAVSVNVPALIDAAAYIAFILFGKETPADLGANTRTARCAVRPADRLRRRKYLKRGR